MPVYVTNARTFGTSEYTGTEWDAAHAVASVNDRVFIVTDTGLYEQAGTDDDGAEIDAHIRSGKLMAGNMAYEKEVQHLWITLAGDEDCELTLYPAYWNGESTLGPYVIPSEDTDEPHNRVVTGLMGTPGQWWGVKIANKDGGKLDIRSLILRLEQTVVVI